MAEHPVQRFLISGCGGSGLRMASRLLSSVGVHCGHESIFGLHSLQSGHIVWPDEVPGDASWLAAPLLHHLEPGTRVVHLVRSPLATVRAICRTRLLEDEAQLDGQMALEFCHALAAPTGARERAARYWVHWNALVEQGALVSGLPYMRLQVEYLDPARLLALTSFLGVALDLRLASVASGTSVGDGERARRKDPTDLLGLPAELESALVMQAARYGYGDPMHAAA